MEGTESRNVWSCANAGAASNAHKTNPIRRMTCSSRCRRMVNACTMGSAHRTLNWTLAVSPRCRQLPTVLRHRARGWRVQRTLARPNSPSWSPDMSAFRSRLPCLLLAMLFCVSAVADVVPGADPRDAALLARMTTKEKINQLMLLSKGTMTGPDSAGRPNLSAEELARSGIGFQMSAFEFSAADINRIQKIAVDESRLGIPVVFATDIIHGYWTVFPVPLGLAASFDPADARIAAGISGLEGYSH